MSSAIVFIILNASFAFAKCPKDLLQAVFSKQAAHRQTFLNTFESLPQPDLVLIGQREELTRRIILKNPVANRKEIFKRLLEKARGTNALDPTHELNKHSVAVLKLKNEKNLWILPDLQERSMQSMVSALDEIGVTNVLAADQFKTLSDLESVAYPFLFTRQSTDLSLRDIQIFYFTPHHLSENRFWRYSTKILGGDITKNTLRGGVLTKKIIAASHSPQKNFISLAQLQPTHRVSYPNAVAKSTQRTINLKFKQQDILERGVLTEGQMSELIPSNLPIKAVMMNGKYYIFSGNGRLNAFRRVFQDYPELKIEIEVFTLKAPSEVPDLVREIQNIRE